MIGYMNVIHNLCSVLCMDYMKIIGDVHPSLTDASDGSSKNISDDTRDGLKLTIQSVQLERKKTSTEVRRFGGLFD